MSESVWSNPGEPVLLTLALSAHGAVVAFNGGRESDAGATIDVPLPNAAAHFAESGVDVVFDLENSGEFHFVGFVRASENLPFK